VNVILAPLAEVQVADAFACIAAERPSAALKWFERLAERVGSLSLLPDQGRMVPEADRESIREVLVQPYRVIYRRDDDLIVILTIQHERRDLDLSEADV
jgi:plasmid stabilization system protein ParE